MNDETARRLCALNNEFYRKHAGSFSATRRSPWQGWARCLEAAGPVCRGRRSLTVLDLACGNLRFERFLASALPEATITCYAVDNCDQLAMPGLCAPSLGPDGKGTSCPDTGAARVHGRNADAAHAPGREELSLGTCDLRYQSLDALAVLLGGQPLDGALTAPPCDLAVSFGFLHHVPSQALRAQVLAALVRQTRPGGFVAVSLWRFLDDPRLAAKAHATHEAALSDLGLPALERGDCLLGWNDVPGQYRYCHSFSEAEIDQLVASVAPAAVPVARFAADGRTGSLNAYVVFEVA